MTVFDVRKVEGGEHKPLPPTEWDDVVKGLIKTMRREKVEYHYLKRRKQPPVQIVALTI